MAFVPQKSKELSINLKYVTTEKSKDSYSITETWKLEKNTLTFSYVNTNKRKTIAPKTVAAKLTASDLDSLVKIIRKNELLVNVPAEKRNEYAVPYTAIGVTLSITAGQEKGSISLYALKNAMGANVYYRHVEKLRSAMRKFIKE
ncbi:MAG TPA: hypothetical protein VD905_08880 [Flavobacteriales bacterium]|nr:hypothetical protein [Flavobacteriales bacterium]